MQSNCYGPKRDYFLTLKYKFYKGKKQYKLVYIITVFRPQKTISFRVNEIITFLRITNPLQLYRL